MDVLPRLNTLRAVMAGEVIATDEETVAATKLLKRLHEAEQALKATNLAALHSEREELLWDDEFDKLSDQQRSRALRISCEEEIARDSVIEELEQEFAAPMKLACVYGRIAFPE